MGNSACFPSYIRTGGTQNAQLLTPQAINFGVLLRLNMSMNSGATVLRTVSAKCRSKNFVLLP